MKNLTLGISVLSLIGVIVIFAMSHTSHVLPANENTINSQSENASLVQNVDRPATGKFAFIDVQRITNEYGYYKEIVVAIQKKQQNAEAEFGRKAQSFQKEYETYMQKAQRGSFLSQASQQQQEADLRSKQEKLALLEKELSQKLQIEMQGLDAQATDTIMSYLKKFNEDAQFDLILNSATILDKGICTDVTDTILSILNQRYEVQKTEAIQ